MKIFTLETIKNEDKATERMTKVISNGDFKKQMDKILDKTLHKFDTVYSEHEKWTVVKFVFNDVLDLGMDFSEDELMKANEIVTKFVLNLINELMNKYMTPKCKEYLAEKFKKECLD